MARILQTRCGLVGGCYGFQIQIRLDKHTLETRSGMCSVLAKPYQQDSQGKQIKAAQMLMLSENENLDVQIARFRNTQAA